MTAKVAEVEAAALPGAEHAAAIADAAERLRPEMLETLKWLYAHPELSGEEHESSKYLVDRATQHGFRVEMGVAGLPTAFRAIKGGGGPGKRVGFLAEYDALPEIGHGCGHNMIGTVGTYAAIVLAEACPGLPGEVALFGTPAEETDGGKITMLEAGVFEGTAAALMMHPGIHTEAAYTSLACVSVVVEFFGRTAHAAASPWKGINALDAMIQLFVAIDQARKAMPATAKAPGVILHGGDRANVIPEYTKAQFSIRGKDRAEALGVYEKLVACGEAAARATGARFEHRVQGNIYDDMRPDPQLAGWFRSAWAEVGGEPPLDHPVPHGSLDIGNLSHQFPCLHPSIRITDNSEMGGHTRDFAEATLTPLAEEQMVKVVRALASVGAAVALSH